MPVILDEWFATVDLFFLLILTHWGPKQPKDSFSSWPHYWAGVFDELELERPDHRAKPRLPLPPLALALRHDGASKHGVDCSLYFGCARKGRQGKESQINAHPSGQACSLRRRHPLQCLPSFFPLEKQQETGRHRQMFPSVQPGWQHCHQLHP